MSNSEASAEDKEDERIVLTIQERRYDVTEYAPVHPGEGHNDIYLEDYAGRDVSKEFAYYHSKADKPEPAEFGSKSDYQFNQALNLLKGLQIISKR